MLAKYDFQWVSGCFALLEREAPGIMRYADEWFCRYDKHTFPDARPALEAFDCLIRHVSRNAATLSWLASFNLEEIVRLPGERRNALAEIFIANAGLSGLPSDEYEKHLAALKELADRNEEIVSGVCLAYPHAYRRFLDTLAHFAQCDENCREDIAQLDAPPRPMRPAQVVDFVAYRKKRAAHSR